jgi:hypothetical protein
MIRDLEFPVLGYHGTRLTLAQEILSNGFHPSANDYDWLGGGIYFFQDAPDRAWDWACQHTQRKYPNDSPAVICSRLRLKNCIDLFDSLPNTGWPLLIKETYNELLISHGNSLPRQQGLRHGLDRLVIDSMINALESHLYIGVIRSVFLEGEMIFPASALSQKGHVQIAIRDLTLIEDSWLLNTGDN